MPSSTRIPGPRGSLAYVADSKVTSLLAPIPSSPLLPHLLPPLSLLHTLSHTHTLTHTHMPGFQHHNPPPTSAGSTYACMHACGIVGMSWTHSSSPSAFISSISYEVSLSSSSARARRGVESKSDDDDDVIQTPER